MSNINSHKDILGFNTVYFIIRSINDTMYLVTHSRCCQYEPKMSLAFDAKFHCHPTFWRINECQGSFIISKSLVCPMKCANAYLSTWTEKNAGRSPHFAGFHLTFTTSTSLGTRTRWMSIGAEVLSRNRHIFE